MEIQVYRGQNPSIVLPLDKGVFTCEKMGIHELVFTFDTSEVLDLQIGDYVTYQLEVMRLNYTPTYTNNGANRKTYSITFEGRRATLYDQPLVDEGDVTFSYFGTPADLMNLILTNINSLDAGWTLNQVDDVAAQAFEFDNVNCLSALNTVAQKFELEWQIKQRVISLKKNIGVERNATLKQGRGNGLYSLTREYLKDSNIVTRAYALGSTQNLPDSYAGKRLSLPDYIEANTDKYGVKVKYYTFDDVFPQRTGVASGVSKIDDKTYTLTDSSLNFDINGQRAGENDVKIVFKSGALNGQEFVISRYDNNSKTITYKANENSNGLLIPFSATIAAVGDQYTLIGLIMPDTYIETAKDTLRQRRADALAKDSIPKVVYSLNSDVLFLKQNGLTLEAGDIIRVQDTDVALDELLTIQKVSYPAMFPQKLVTGMQFTAEVGNTSYSKIQDSIYNAVQQQIVINGELNRANLETARKNALNLRELKNYIFDADDYFDATHIKPQSIETQMLTVGARSQNFLLVGVNMEANYMGNANAFNVTGGQLQHLEISISAGYVWTLNAQNFVNLDPTKAYYLAAKCSKFQLIGTFNLLENPYKVEEQFGFYNFQIGVLYPVKDGKRYFYATAGTVTVVGSQINAGRLSSRDKNTYFDLDTGEISGNIKFTAAQKADIISGVQVGGRNLVLNSDNYITTGIKDFSFSFENDINQLRGKYVTISVYVEVENATGSRIGFEPAIQYTDTDALYMGVWYYPANGANFKGRISATFQIKDKPITPNWMLQRGIYVQCSGSVLKVGRPKIEFGNTATDWSPAPEDTTAQLAEVRAYADAQDALQKTIQEAYADGIVTAEEQARINADAAHLEQARADAQERALAMSWSNGRCLNPDADFRQGNNGLHIYDNNGSGNISLRRLGRGEVETPPTTSPNVLYFENLKGGASPGFGGFYFGTFSRAGAKFLVRMLLAFEPYQTIEFASNAFGDGSTSRWLTSNVGAGRYNYRDYIYYVECGNSGNFSDTNYFYFTSTQGIATCRIAFASVYDITDSTQIDSQLAEVRANATALANKTNFLAETQINGNNVATGVVQVGNNTDGANGGISGFGDVAFWAGSNFANAPTAPFNVLRNGTVNMNRARINSTAANGGRVEIANGQIIIYDANGNRRIVDGIIDGIPGRYIYAADGVTIISEDSTRGRIDRNFIYENWTERLYMYLNQNAPTIDANAAMKTLRDIFIKNVTKISGTTWQYTYSINTPENCYEYSAGTHPDTQQFKDLEGYKTEDGNRTANIANGWYAFEFGTLLTTTSQSGSSTFTINYSCIYVFNGKINNNYTVQITK